MRNPAKTGRLPFGINILEDRDSSKEEAENVEEEIQIFLDSSAMNGKVGTAVTLMRAGQPDRTLHYHLGPDSEHTVHKAELISIMLGVHLVKTEKKGNTSFAIGVDNQATLKAFELDLRRPALHLAHEIIHTANILQKTRRKKKYSLQLQWTAGHEGIEGNEKADQEAKAAAEGKQLNKKSLPPYLR